MSIDDTGLLWTGLLAIGLVLIAGYLLGSLQEALDSLRARRNSPPLYKKNKHGFMVDGSGYDIHGIHWQSGRDASGYDADGYDAEGLNIEGFNRRGFDRWGNHESGARFSDETGLDAQGKNIHGNFPRTDEELTASLNDYLATRTNV